MMINLKIINFDFRVFIFINKIGRINETSTSNTKNRINIIKYFVEKTLFLLYFMSNPHSKGFIFIFLLLVFSSKNLNNIKIVIVNPAMTRHIIFIDSFF